MRSPLLAVLVSGVVVLIVWLVSTPEQPVIQTIRQARQAWLEPATPVRQPTPALVLARPAAAQTAVPPTLQPPTPQPPIQAATVAPTVGPIPAPTSAPTVLAGPSTVRSYTVPLAGGGEMTVLATDLAGALDNVVAQGGTPDLPAPESAVNDDAPDAVDVVAEVAAFETAAIAPTPPPPSTIPVPLPAPRPLIVPPAVPQPAPPQLPAPAVPARPAPAATASLPEPITRLSARDSKPDKGKPDKDTRPNKAPKTNKGR